MCYNSSFILPVPISPSFFPINISIHQTPYRHFIKIVSKCKSWSVFDLVGELGFSLVDIALNCDCDCDLFCSVINIHFMKSLIHLHSHTQTGFFLQHRVDRSKWRFVKGAKSMMEKKNENMVQLQCVRVSCVEFISKNI